MRERPWESSTAQGWPSPDPCSLTTPLPHPICCNIQYHPPSVGVPSSLGIIPPSLAARQELGCRAERPLICLMYDLLPNGVHCQRGLALYTHILHTLYTYIHIYTHMHTIHTTHTYIHTTHTTHTYTHTTHTTEPEDKRLRGSASLPPVPSSRALSIPEAWPSEDVESH